MFRLPVYLLPREVWAGMGWKEMGGDCMVLERREHPKGR